LARLRARGEGGVDQQYTIDQLREQRDNLLEEMNKLKKEQQLGEALSASSKQVTAKPRRKKQFGQVQT